MPPNCLSPLFQTLIFLSLQFLDFLAFSLQEFSLLFWSVFPFFPKGFRGSTERKILAFLGGFLAFPSGSPCFSPKYKGKKRSGNCTRGGGNCAATVARKLRGAYSSTGRSRHLLETAFSEPLLRTLLRTLFYCQTHSRPLFRTLLRTPSPEPFPEASENPS